jgi:hypothetical protein
LPLIVAKARQARFHKGNLVKTLSAIVTNLSGVMYIIAGIALIGIVTLTVADVTLRMFSRPIMGTYELVGLLGAIMVRSSSRWCSSLVMTLCGSE